VGEAWILSVGLFVVAISEWRRGRDRACPPKLDGDFGVGAKEESGWSVFWSWVRTIPCGLPNQIYRCPAKYIFPIFPQSAVLFSYEFGAN
jgi:hypothetical protein